MGSSSFIWIIIRIQNCGYWSIFCRFLFSIYRETFFIFFLTNLLPFKLFVFEFKINEFCCNNVDTEKAETICKIISNYFRYKLQNKTKKLFYILCKQAAILQIIAGSPQNRAATPLVRLVTRVFIRFVDVGRGFLAEQARVRGLMGILRILASVGQPVNYRGRQKWRARGKGCWKTRNEITAAAK